MKYNIEKINGIAEKLAEIIEEADRILETYFRYLEQKNGVCLPFGYLRLRDHTAIWNAGKLKRRYNAPKAVFDYILDTVIASDALPEKELLTVLLHEGMHLNSHGFNIRMDDGALDSRRIECADHRSNFGAIHG